MKVICKQCGKEFEAPDNQKNRKFCSRECFYESERKPGKRCAVCGKGIVSNSAKTQCCSRSCAGVLRSREGKARKKQEPKQSVRMCKVCGKTFVAPAGSQRVLCSTECKSALYRQVHPPAEPKTERMCPGCGKAFMPRCKQQIYCCGVCSQASRQKTAQKAPIVELLITKHIPVYEHLRPRVGQVYPAEDHRVYGGPFFIIPDIGGKRIVVRANECRVVAK